MPQTPELTGSLAALVKTGHDRVELLPCDAGRCFVYWEVTAAGLRAAQETALPKPQIEVELRKHDGVVEARVSVERWLDGAFVDIPSEGAPVYVAVLGVRAPDGELWVIATSDAVAVSSAHSGSSDPQFATVLVTSEGLVTSATSHQAPASGTFAQPITTSSSDRA